MLEVRSEMSLRRENLEKMYLKIFFLLRTANFMHRVMIINTFVPVVANSSCRKIYCYMLTLDHFKITVSSNLHQASRVMRRCKVLV